MTDGHAGHGAAPGRSFREPAAAELLDRPLDFLLADHARLRSACTVLKAAAETGRMAPEDAAALAAFLARDAGLHHRDETEDLFPAVRRRTRPEDDIEPLLRRIETVHRDGGRSLDAILAALALAAASDGGIGSPAARQAMAAYVRTTEEEIAMENGVVIAIAQARLTRRDLKAMAAAMRSRRGLGGER